MVAAPSIGCADATDLGWVAVVGAATHMISMFSLSKVSSSSCRQCCYCSCGLGHNTAPVQQALVTVKLGNTCCIFKQTYSISLTQLWDGGCTINRMCRCDRSGLGGCCRGSHTHDQHV